ncbi:hypothetical protein [Rhodococcus jostii]|uniref:hypothetical protein n=1 Tax=Rhodococcus jostii TaxID=132919 RepID=UPI003631C7C9
MAFDKKNRLRKLAYLPLTAAIAAGAVCTGAGVSAAAADMTAESNATTQWHVYNYTDQELTGVEFYKQVGDHTSEIAFGAPLAAGDDLQGTLEFPATTTYRFYTWGRVCYDHKWWNLKRDGSREGPSYPYGNVYIYALNDEHGLGKRLVANPDGAKVNVPMFATDKC